LYLTNIAERVLFGSKKRETLVFGGEFVGVVDAVVAAVAEDGFIGGAKDRCIVFVTHVALDLHGLKV